MLREERYSKSCQVALESLCSRLINKKPRVLGEILGESELLTRTYCVSVPNFLQEMMERASGLV